MAALVTTVFDSSAVPVVATVNTASASDTITYVAGSNQMVELDNTTAGSLTVVIKGTAPSAAYFVPATGTNIDLTAGFSVVVAAGVKKVVNLDKISAYLVGTGVVTLSGAATLKITIYS